MILDIDELAETRQYTSKKIVLKDYQKNGNAPEIKGVGAAELLLPHLCSSNFGDGG